MAEYDDLLAFLTQAKPREPEPVLIEDQDALAFFEKSVVRVQPLKECLAPTVSMLVQHLDLQYPFQGAWTQDEAGTKAQVLDFIRQLYATGPFSLSDINVDLMAAYDGPGIYMLHYCGTEPYYEHVRSVGSLITVYAGVSAGPDGSILTRIKSHIISITEGGLSCSDFTFRIMRLDSPWALAAESILISNLRPIWNGLGFGDGRPRKRKTQAKSAWDVLHPGRKGAGQRDHSKFKTPEDVIDHLHKALILSSRTAHDQIFPPCERVD